MSRAQRIGFLAVAAVIALGAVLLLARPGSDDEAERTAAPRPPRRRPRRPRPDDGGAEAETPTPEPTPTPKPKPPLLTSATGDKTLDFEEGETVRFRVRSSQPEEVHVHGYDIYKDIGPGKTATISFKGEITGIFEVEFHNAGAPIGRLKVEPVASSAAGSISRPARVPPGPDPAADDVQRPRAPRARASRLAATALRWPGGADGGHRAVAGRGPREAHRPGRGRARSSAPGRWPCVPLRALAHVEHLQRRRAPAARAARGDGERARCAPSAAASSYQPAIPPRERARDPR